jgi:hypothetical protein
VYNIPTLPKADSPKSDASALPPSTDGTAAPSSPKPEMTANPTQCPSAALRVAGDCPHCSRVFCGTHRTPESHNWLVHKDSCYHGSSRIKRIVADPQYRYASLPRRRIPGQQGEVGARTNCREQDCSGITSVIALRLDIEWIVLQAQEG